MKHKNLFILSAFFLFIVLSVFALHKVAGSYQKKKDVYQTIPSFILADFEGKTITDADMEKGKPVLFYFFDPGCELCKAAFTHVNDYMAELSDKQVVFFTIQPPDTISAYLKQINFTPPVNMRILIDEYAELVSSMEIKGPPSSLIYNKHGRLTKRFNGPVKTETLIRYLSE